VSGTVYRAFFTLIGASGWRKMVGIDVFSELVLCWAVINVLG